MRFGSLVSVLVVITPYSCVLIFSEKWRVSDMKYTVSVHAVVVM